MARSLKQGIAFALTVVAALVVPTAAPSAQQPPVAAVTASLVPTNHPRVPADLSQLWLAPDHASASTAGSRDLTDAVKLLVKGDYAKALAAFSQPALQVGPLSHYAMYYAGLAQLRLGHAAE